MKITRADRYMGTDRITTVGSHDLLFLQGRQYDEFKEVVLRLSDDETKFYHRITLDDPNLPVKEVEVSKEEW